MNLEPYRIYGNRPKPLMGCPIVYRIPDSALLDDDNDVEAAIKEKHPTAKNVETMRHAAWTYIGLIAPEEASC